MNSALEFSSAIKDAIRDRADDLFRQVWGDPAKVGARQWRARESSARSMEMRGPKRGLWIDHKSGESGDILDFVAVQLCGLSRARDDFPRVIEEASRFCGLSRETPVDLTGLQARRAARDAQLAKETVRDALRNAALIEALQTRCVDLEWSPADTYLTRRGVTKTPPGWSYLPPVLGLHVPSPGLGALVAWATDENGAVKGGQRVLVLPDGSPANVTPRKPAFGAIGGFPARILARVPGAPLVICEGPETAAAVWQVTGFETWAVFGAGQFEAAPVPPNRKAIFCPDCDAPGSPAADAFERACIAQAARGVDLWIARAPEPEGSKHDLNDTLQRAGKAAVAEAINAAAKFTPRADNGRFTGAGAVPIETPAPMPVFLNPDEARERIRQAVKAFLAKASEWQAARTVMEKYHAAEDCFNKGTRKNQPESPPDEVIELSMKPALALAIAATPGTGKSTISREVLAEFDLTAMPGDAMFHAPTLALADEAAAHAASLGAGDHVTRGRSARSPATGEPMCNRSELAERVAKAGKNVRATLCERKDGDKLARCPYADGCAYLQQWQSLGAAPALRFEASQYLTLPGDGSERETGLQIIDETVWRLFTGKADLTYDTWLRPRTPRGGQTLAKEAKAVERAADATAAASEVLAALQAGKSPVLDKYTAEDFAAFADAERGAEILHSLPDAPDSQLADDLATAEAIDLDAGRRAAVWAVLANCKRRGLDTTERLYIARRVPSPGTGEPRDVVRVLWFKELRRDVPTLILDADADPELTERMFPGAELVRFDLEPNAEVLQLTDRTFSTNSLQRPEVRRELVALVRAEVYRDRLDGGRGVLAIATKKAVRWMFEDAGHDFAGKAEAEISELMQKTELHGARWLWFGPASLGQNAWQDFGTALVIGREELPIDGLEDLARGFWGDTGALLKFVETDASGRQLMPEEPLPVTMTDGSAWAIPNRTHPDPRVRALQLQTRELATRQAFERLRLVNATDRKRVVLASKVPVPGLPVNRLVIWAEMKPTRLQAAMAEAATRGSVLRLSAAGLATDAPETFTSTDVAQVWLRRGGQDEIKWGRTANSIPITGTSLFNPVLAELRLKGQRGRATPALILVPGDPRALAEAQFGALAGFDLVDGPPAENLTKPNCGDQDARAREGAVSAQSSENTQDIIDLGAARAAAAVEKLWDDGAKFAKAAEQSRTVARWRESEAGIFPVYKKAAPVPRPAIPIPEPLPVRRLVVLPDAEQLNSPLVAEFLQQRAARTAAEQAAVVTVFEAYRQLDEWNPDAWQ